MSTTRLRPTEVTRVQFIHDFVRYEHSKQEKWHFPRAIRFVQIFLLLVLSRGRDKVKREFLTKYEKKWKVIKFEKKWILELFFEVSDVTFFF